MEIYEHISIGEDFFALLHFTSHLLVPAITPCWPNHGKVPNCGIPCMLGVACGFYALTELV